MNPEKQRMTISEACGWKETEAWLDGRRCFERADSNAGWDFDSLPDFLYDLNAMHEAEKMLTVDQLIEQAEWLGASSNEMPIKSWVVLLRATASQRAEAFLRTIGKWEEAK